MSASASLIHAITVLFTSFLRASVVTAYIYLARQQARLPQRNRATLRTVSELLTPPQPDKIALAISTHYRDALLHIEYTIQVFHAN